MCGILKRFPSVENAEIRSFINGPESFTPDGNPHVSVSKEVSSASFFLQRNYSSICIEYTVCRNFCYWVFICK